MEETMQGTDRLQCPHCRSLLVKGLGVSEKLMESVGGYVCICLDCRKKFFFHKGSSEKVKKGVK